MKAILLLWFAALSAAAQTNIFPQLLSPSNSVLMTNAEFRSFAGDKIIFKNDDGYQTFHAADLNTNVLAALNITPEQLELQQQKIDAENAQFRQEQAAAQIRLAQEKLAQEQEALAEQANAAAAATQTAQTSNSNPLIPQVAETRPNAVRRLNNEQYSGAYHVGFAFKVIDGIWDVTQILFG